MSNLFLADKALAYTSILIIKSPYLLSDWAKKRDLITFVKKNMKLLTRKVQYTA